MKEVFLAICVMVASAPANLCAQGLGLPDPDVLERQLREEGAISDELPPFDPADYVEPEIGKVRQFERKAVSKIKTQINDLLQEAPQEGTWTAKANKVVQKIGLFEASELRSDFLKSIPFLLSSSQEVANLDLDRREEEEPVETQYQSLLEELGWFIRAEIYNLVKEKEATLTNEEWAWVSQMSLGRTLWSMRLWEDHSNYITAPGGFIVDADKATMEIKSKPLKEIKTFLGGDTDSGFFERYEADGNGMGIL